ncbi:endonuclease/exonuclease/phosphatase family protein [Flavobacterium sp. SM15]|uniref:endonuclease/exonuclease/phosphatase family protein n=1 Tax=Flavobacterium sp. SM15 TaxID=2908005 RepID=UPI001EDA5A2C|nr:endonuclease/exonuclease/phosphatase family protein [Flavobacterium sp. SM15]MCG2611168.1 endonuclease/exonuclease/phosphatase family protein [Flavobacterium sp. SM15]
MKKLSWLNKLAFFFNIVLAVLTFVAYLLPFLAPKMFPFLSVLTLVLPLMLILNILFLCFWLIQLKRQAFLSAVVFLIGITFFNKFYKFSGKDLIKEDNDFTVMSYNVRLFNVFEWMSKQNIPEDIIDFVGSQDPDILCIQEYSSSANIKLEAYKYKYILIQGDNIRTGQAIFSKFPIVNRGEIEFPNSDNNVIFADIKKKRDTIRVYSIHLQSTKISPDIHEDIDEAKSKKIFRRMSEAFAEQQIQSELIKEHKTECNYPKIICGDMNNSAFSYVYRNIKGNMKDAFEEAGEGFGKTYDYEFYPARIDYILLDKQFDVKSFKTFDKFVNSDHFPIVTRISLKDE